jgi:predicted protein tyrosine phosphatase
MTLIVCPLAAVEAELARTRPARMVSLLAPEQAAPEAPTGVRQLVLRFHDLAAPAEGLIAPDAALVSQLLAFAAEWTEPAPMLVHCWMGISRSPAAALAIACARAPHRDEAEIATALRRASPTATPNPLIVALADRLLGRDGRLIAAAAAIGRGMQAATGSPFELMARLG